MWRALALALLCSGCAGQNMQTVVRTLDAAHVPSCIRAQYQLHASLLGQAGDGVMVVIAAAGGATLAQCVSLLEYAPHRQK
jgi:hypothetical protein